MYHTLSIEILNHLPSVSLEGSSSPLLPSSASARQPPCQALSVSWKLQDQNTCKAYQNSEHCPSMMLGRVSNRESRNAPSMNVPEAVQHWSNHLICQLLGKPSSHPPNAEGLNNIDYCNTTTLSHDLLLTCQNTKDKQQHGCVFINSSGFSSVIWKVCYPFAADQRTIVSLSFSPNSRCSVE